MAKESSNIPPHHWCLPSAQHVRSIRTLCAKHQDVERRFVKMENTTSLKIFKPKHTYPTCNAVIMR